jgi:hypothetical protein
VEISSANELGDLMMKVIVEQKSTYVGSIEEYLRSVWSSILVHRNDAPTYHLFGEILQKAFHAQPAPFESEWMKYNAAPQELRSLMVLEKPFSREADFTCLKREILFLIAELHRMQDHVQDKMKHFGVVSPTGHSWYNWDPFTYLECAMAGLISHREGGLLKRADESRCNWSLFAFILELGRIYE